MQRGKIDCLHPVCSTTLYYLGSHRKIGVDPAVTLRVWVIKINNKHVALAPSKYAQRNQPAGYASALRTRVANILTAPGPTNQPTNNDDG